MKDFFASDLDDALGVVFAFCEDEGFGEGGVAGDFCRGGNIVAHVAFLSDSFSSIVVYIIPYSK